MLSENLILRAAALAIVFNTAAQLLAHEAPKKHEKLQSFDTVDHHLATGGQAKGTK